MTITGEHLSSLLGSIRLPVSVMYAKSDDVAIEAADLEMLTELAEGGSVEADLQRNGKPKRFRLTRPLSELSIILRKDQLPIAADCRTLFRQNLGDGKFSHTFKQEVAEAYSPAMRRVTA